MLIGLGMVVVAEYLFWICLALVVYTYLSYPVLLFVAYSLEQVIPAIVEATGHPVIEGYDPPEGWGWCYVDEVMFDAL